MTASELRAQLTAVALAQVDRACLVADELRVLGKQEKTPDLVIRAKLGISPEDYRQSLRDLEYALAVRTSARALARQAAAQTARIVKDLES